MNQLDTIAAVSTPYGKGGIAVLRVSGSDAVDVSSRVFSPVGNRSLFDIPSAKATYGSISQTVDGVKAVATDDISEPYAEDNDYPPLHGTSDNSRAFIIQGHLLKGGLNELTLLLESKDTEAVKIDYLDIFPARYSTK